MADENKGAVYYALRFFQLITFLCGALIFVVFLITFINVVTGFNPEAEFSWYFLLYSLYGMIFAVVIMLVEFRLQRLFEELPALKNWAVRGFFYIFIGLLAIVGTLSVGISVGSTIDIDPQTLALLIKGTGWTLMGLGACLIVGEVTCCRSNVAHPKMQKAIGNQAIV